ncbi:MAG: hypothetical protein ACE5G0_11805 [Rhodothermales bacterium]
MRPAFYTLSFLSLLALFLLPSFAHAQDEETAMPPAKPEDVQSVDAIIAATYDVISGAAGEPRDWDRFRSLLAPYARFVPIRRFEDGTHRGVLSTPEQFIEGASAYFAQNGFYETESARTTERYGNLVHAFSTYESRHTPDDEAPWQRGINSFQLIYENDRWWVISIAWQPEWPDLPIPAKYLPDGGQ